MKVRQYRTCSSKKPAVASLLSRVEKMGSITFDEQEGRVRMESVLFGVDDA